MTNKNMASASATSTAAERSVGECSMPSGLRFWLCE